jgi:hypothetical protein
MAKSITSAARRANRPDSAVVLGYKLKLCPNRVKSDLLALLCMEFGRLHATALERLSGEHPAKPVTLKGLKQAGTGEFAQRATRRAVLDLQRQRKALASRKRKFSPWPVPLPYLQAEILDAAELQKPRHAEHFDCWIHVEGLSRECQLYLPAKFHDALNKSLALPGAMLGKSAEIFRRDGQWYARVSVTVPQPESILTSGVIGADVGVRAAVATSDGRKSRSLHPVLNRTRDKHAERQRRLETRRTNGLSYQRQVLCKEARRLVTLAERTGRAVALENPDRLIRWRQHAARFFAKRVSLLGALIGVPVVLVNPAYTSRICSCCGSRESDRHRTQFHCFGCGHTANADVNAARNIEHAGAAAFRAARSMGTSTSPLRRAAGRFALPRNAHAGNSEIHEHGG